MNTPASASDGTVNGGVRFTMQSEALAVFATATLFYFQAGYSWQMFAVLFLVPDISMIGYLVGPRLGALTYNLGHAYVGPAALAAYGLMQHVDLAIPVALIWFAHVGFDRMLGFGLKYGDAFTHTHLGHVGWAVRKHA